MLARILPINLARRGFELYKDNALTINEEWFDTDACQIEADVVDGYEVETLSLNLSFVSGQLRSYCTCEKESPCVHIAAILCHILQKMEDDLTGTAETNRKGYISERLMLFTVPQLRSIAKRHDWKIKGTRKAIIVEQLVDRYEQLLDENRFFAALSPGQASLLSALHMTWDMNIGVNEPEIASVFQNVLKQSGKPKKLLTALVEYGAVVKDNEFEPPRFQSVVPLKTWQIETRVLDIAPRPKRRILHARPVAPAPPLIGSLQTIAQQIDGRSIELAEPSYEQAKPGALPWGDEWPTLQSEIGKGRSIYDFMSGEERLTLPIKSQVFDLESADSLKPYFPDRDYLDWVITMMQRLYLLVPETERRFQLEPDAWEKFSQQQPQEQQELLLAGWRSLADEHMLRIFLQNNPNWTLWRMLHPGLPYEFFQDDLRGAIRTVVRYLEQLALYPASSAEQNWFSLEAFTQAIRKTRAELFHTYAGVEAWGFKFKGEPVAWANNSFWGKLYSELIRLMFQGPLYWLGVVSLLDRNGKTVAFQLTPTGRWLLNPREPLDASGSKTDGPTKWEWLDAATVKLSLGNDRTAALALANRYMRHQVGKINQYKLDPERLEAAFSKGATANSIQAEFDELKAPLHSDCALEILRLHMRYGGVHLYEELTVIEFSDEYALSELRAARILTEEMIVHQFSPCLIVVEDKSIDGIVRDMKKKKYTPRVIA